MKSYEDRVSEYRVATERLRPVDVRRVPAACIADDQPDEYVRVISDGDAAQSSREARERFLQTLSARRPGLTVTDEAAQAWWPYADTDTN